MKAEIPSSCNGELERNLVVSESRFINHAIKVVTI